METYISKYKHTCNFLYLGTYIHKHNFSFGAPVLNFQSNETIVLIFEVARVVRIDCGISEFSFHKTINDIVYYPLFYFGPSFHGFDFCLFKIFLWNHCLQQFYCFCTNLKSIRFMIPQKLKQQDEAMIFSDWINVESTYNL